MREAIRDVAGGSRQARAFDLLMTRLTVDVSSQRVFEPRWYEPEVSRLLAEGLRRRAALGLWLLDDGGVRLSIEPGDAAGVTLTGTWRSPALASPPQGVGAMLLLPFLVLVRGLVLPHQCLYSLGHGDDTLADLFLRNFFHAATRGEYVRLLQADQALSDAAQTCSRDLVRSYGQLMKAQFQDPVFGKPNAADLILANAHLRLFAHSSALLEKGAAQWRQVVERGTHAALPDGCGRTVVQHRHVWAFAHDWQVPAATEKAAYGAVTAMPVPPRWQYVGFPWATLMDGLSRNAACVGPLLAALKALHQAPLRAARRVTVAQHIHALQYIDLFTACGITDVFWSHATHQQPVHQGVRLHGFALYPAQAPAFRRDLSLARPRRYLANFIGAYSAGLYLSNVRDVIFKDAGRQPDLLIVKRDAWHFDRAVYQEQIKGMAAQPLQLSQEQALAQEYIQGICESWFTLCPSGSGPNSIRIFESLALMSIPIILCRSLKLPGPPGLWQKAALIDDDSEAGYRRALAKARALSTEQRLQMLQAGQALAAVVMPAGYAELIQAGLDQPDATHAHAKPMSGDDDAGPTVGWE